VTITCTLSLIPTTPELLVTILSGRTVGGGTYLGKITLDFEEGKGTRDAIGMRTVMSEGNLDKDEEFCAYFIVWQQALDHVNWTKLLQIMIETGMNWRERIFVRK